MTKIYTSNDEKEKSNSHEASVYLYDLQGYGATSEEAVKEVKIQIKVLIEVLKGILDE